MTSTAPLQHSAPPFTGHGRRCCSSGGITDGDADTWLHQLAGAACRGHFFWALTMFAVASKRL